jgi:hypothetical protein
LIGPRTHPGSLSSDKIGDLVALDFGDIRRSEPIDDDAAINNGPPEKLPDKVSILLPIGDQLGWAQAMSLKAKAGDAIRIRIFLRNQSFFPTRRQHRSLVRDSARLEAECLVELAGLSHDSVDQVRLSADRITKGQNIDVGGEDGSAWQIGLGE